MNKIVIDGKEIELSDDILEVIHHALYEYPDYKRFKEEGFKEECKKAYDICNTIFEYFMNKKK